VFVCEGGGSLIQESYRVCIYLCAIQKPQNEAVYVRFGRSAPDVEVAAAEKGGGEEEEEEETFLIVRP
jgi:hypothetical protein